MFHENEKLNNRKYLNLNQIFKIKFATTIETI